MKNDNLDGVTVENSISGFYICKDKKKLFISNIILNRLIESSQKNDDGELIVINSKIKDKIFSTY